MTDEEINEAVPTKIMGWTKIDRRAMGWGDGPIVWSTGDENAPTFQGFDPATDIGHAWMAVEMLLEVPGDYDFRMEYRNGEWWVSLEYWDDEWHWWTNDSSAPRAIALATLRAVGVEVEG